MDSSLFVEEGVSSCMVWRWCEFGKLARGKGREGTEWKGMGPSVCFAFFSFWCAGLDNCVCISVGGERLSIPLL